MSKQLYTLEYPVRCSPTILYDFLATPAGLGEWFADKVDEKENIFYFGWSGSFENAEVMEKEQDKFIRFHWVTAPKGEYITDFAEKKEIKDQSNLWDFQVKELIHRLGA